MKPRAKIICILIVMAIFAALLSLPYVYSLLGDSLDEARVQLGLSKTVYNLIIMGQASVIYTIAAITGGLLYQKAGFRAPILEKIFSSTSEEIDYRSWFFYSAGIGIVIALVIIAGDFIFYWIGSPLSLFNTQLPPWWTGILAALSAGIGEELLMRFMLMTVFTIAFQRLLKASYTSSVWGSIIITAVIFGILHLPPTSQIVELTPLVIARALLLNGVGAIGFGFLYWKKGIESAMAAHFITDIAIHAVFPFFI